MKIDRYDLLSAATASPSIAGFGGCSGGLRGGSCGGLGARPFPSLADSMTGFENEQYCHHDAADRTEYLDGSLNVGWACCCYQHRGGHFAPVGSAHGCNGSRCGHGRIFMALAP
jgi:hypothetical protein